MPSHSHLSSDERAEIAVLSAAGQSIGAIARSLEYKTPFQAMLADLGKDVKIRFA